MADKNTNALQVLVLTPHIYLHLTHRDPKALEQAVSALRETLTGQELEAFEAALARRLSERTRTARITIHLPEGHWSHSHRNGEATFEEIVPHRAK